MVVDDRRIRPYELGLGPRPLQMAGLAAVVFICRGATGTSRQVSQDCAEKSGSEVITTIICSMAQIASRASSYAVAVGAAPRLYSKEGAHANVGLARARETGHSAAVIGKRCSRSAVFIAASVTIAVRTGYMHFGRAGLLIIGNNSNILADSLF